HDLWSRGGELTAQPRSSRSVPLATAQRVASRQAGTRARVPRGRLYYALGRVPGLAAPGAVRPPPGLGPTPLLLSFQGAVSPSRLASGPVGRSALPGLPAAAPSR